MTRGVTSSAVAFLVLICSSLSRAALTPEMVQRAKAATALVEIRTQNDKIEGFGSAFCVDPAGLFVTNAHVAEAVRDAKLTLILSPGEKTQRMVNATVLKADKTADLALLLADLGDGALLPSLELGESDALAETMEIAAFGYPFGGALAFNKGEYPSISVNTGRVTALRKKDGELELIQVDAVLNPGNSGGPVLDANGRVIGIVVAGLKGAGINFSIPVNRLKKVADKPIVLIHPTDIAYTNRYAEQVVTVRVASLAGALTGCTVDLSLTGQATPRVLSGPLVDGAFTAKVIPVAKDAAAIKNLAISAQFADGIVVGHLPDCSFKVGATPVKLSSIQQIERNAATPGVATVTLTTGKDLSGAITGLELSAVNLGGGAAVSVDLSKALSLTVSDVEQPSPGVSYKIVVKLKGGTAAEESGVIAFSGAPAVPAVAAISTTLKPATSRLPASPDAPIDIMAGGSGMPTNTPVAGGNGGGEFTKKTDPARDVIGFKYSVADWGNRPVMRDLLPIYAADDPVIAAAAAEKADPRRREYEGVVLAKPGYVVGGVLVDSDDNARAVKVIFMRQIKGKPNPADQYTSDWIGRATSGQRLKQIAGHGERVIGVCGRKGMNCDALGLVVIQ